MPTKKARGYLLSQFYRRIERSWRFSVLFWGGRFSRNLAIHIVP